MPVNTCVTLPPNDPLVEGLLPSEKKTLFDMYSARGEHVPIYVTGEGQSLEDTRDALMLYSGEPFGLNLVVERYLYHLDFIDGMYMTVKVKGE